VTRNVDLETAAFTELADVDTWRVYADWLQSVGDPRGELASLELLRLDAFASERKKIDEQVRERELPYRDAWQTWARAHGLTDVEATFKRGFVHAVTGPLAQLEPVLDELFEREPIQRLELRDVRADGLQRVCGARPAWFERLRYLRLFGRVGAKGAEALAKVSLRRLTRLNLLGAGIGKSACSHLAQLDTPQLRALTLTSNKIDGTGLGELLESPMRTHWRELYLSCNPIESEGITRLAAATELEQLERLCACETVSSFAEYEPLLSPNLRGLKQVELSARGAWSEKKLQDKMRKRWRTGLRLA
jgi:uncharacterized protein (TIGR02996 family)